MHEDRDKRDDGQGRKRRLFLDAILGDIRLGAELAARLWIGAAAMAFPAAIPGLFAFREPGQAIPALQKENRGTDKDRDNASAHHFFVLDV